MYVLPVTHSLLILKHYLYAVYCDAQFLYIYPCMQPTKTPAPTAFPNETSKICSIAPDHKISAPLKIPRGMVNMFATLCSRPSATNAVTGIQTAAILPPVEVAVLAWNTARFTSQFAPIDLMKSGENEREHFFAARAAAYIAGPEPGGNKQYEAAAAIVQLAARLPKKLIDMSLAELPNVLLVQCFINPTVPYSMFDVSKSVPVRTMSESPVGNTSAVTRLNTPGTLSCSIPEPPATK